MTTYLTDERLSEIKTELEHDLWPPVADIAALVEEVQATREAQGQAHGAMRGRMYLIGENQVMSLDQIVYAYRDQGRISVRLAGIEEDFTFYDQQFSAGSIDALWEAIKDAPPAEEGVRGMWQRYGGRGPWQSYKEKT